MRIIGAPILLSYPTMLIRMRRLLVFAVAMAGFALAHGGQVTIPVSLDLDVVDQALLRQLFTGPERSAEVFTDPLGCNALTLEDPRVESAEGDLIRITSRLSARLG